VVRDGRTGRLRPSSGNFRDRDDELSVSVASDTTQQQFLAAYQGSGIARFTVRDVRELGGDLAIRRDPRPSDPSHALIIGRFGKSQARALADKCEWVIAPRLVDA